MSPPRPPPRSCWPLPSVSPELLAAVATSELLSAAATVELLAAAVGCSTTELLADAAATAELLAGAVEFGARFTGIAVGAEAAGFVGAAFLPMAISVVLHT